MKIFGFELGSRNQNKISSAQSVVVVRNVQSSDNQSDIPISKIAKIKPVVLSYAQTFARGRGNFTGAEYDLSEIGVAEDTESILRQAFKKKHGLMFKEGLDYSGANKDTLRYIKSRMAQIARATDIPSVELLKRIGASLIRTSNAFLIKVRNTNSSGGKTRKDASGKTFKPIAGYFPAAPETMRMDVDQETGQIVQWRQMLPDGRFKDFPVSDVVHFSIDKREGFSFGVPVVVPVLDDIRALRQIEENIELLLYQYLFPLFHYQVGTETAPAGYTEDGIREVDAVRSTIELMPAEGAIVTPERHTITALGVEGRALRAEGYLDYFTKRIYTGLGVSSVDMGDGATANRATANTLSRQLVDSVKDIQDSLESQWDHLVVSELLLESTFGDNVLNEENMVNLVFHEIDLQNKMEKDKHTQEMFKENMLTWDEARAELNREPIPVPEDPNDQDPNSWPEWFNTAWKLFQEPTALINAVDEPYGLAAQQAAASRSLSATGGDVQQAQTSAEQNQQKQAELDKQTKIAVVKAKPVPRRKDNFLSNSFDDLENDIVNRVTGNLLSTKNINTDQLLSLARIWSGDMTKKFHSLAVFEMIRGFNRETNNQAAQAELFISLGRSGLYERLSGLLDRLVRDTIRLVSRRVDSIDEGVKLSEGFYEPRQQVHLVFDTLKYRTYFMWDMELRKAYNYGRLLGLRYLGKDSFTLQVHDTACEKCRAVSGKSVRVAGADIEDVPPLHPYSKVQMVTIES